MLDVIDFGLMIAYVNYFEVDDVDDDDNYADDDNAVIDDEIDNNGYSDDILF
jgi:hypothetical protein